MPQAGEEAGGLSVLDGSAGLGRPCEEGQQYESQGLHRAPLRSITMRWIVQ